MRRFLCRLPGRAIYRYLSRFVCRFPGRSRYRHLDRFVYRLPDRSINRPLGRFMYRLPDRFLGRLIDRFLGRLLDRSACRLLDRVPYHPPKGFLARLFSRFAFAFLAALVTPLSSAARPPRLPLIGLRGPGSRASAQRTRAPRVLPPPSGTSRRMEIRHFHHRLTEVPSVDMLIEA